MSQRLVFGDDGSAAADLVWSWIGAHAWPGWRVSVVTALPPEGPPVGPERAALRPWTPPSPRPAFAADVPVEHLMAEKDPRLVLDSCADAALVAIGPRGAGLLKHLHLGSTAEWLVSAHRPLAPVVVVRASRRTERVLLCTDGSVHARAAARAFARLPWAGACRVVVLGVAVGGEESAPGVDETVELLTDAGVADVEARTRGALTSAAAFDVRAVLHEEIEQDLTDLVVMGSRGLGGVRRVLLGSTASSLVRHAPCSVLVAHEEETG